MARPRRLPAEDRREHRSSAPWGYEALDAKLARAEKPTYVLQLCFYSDGIAGVQGRRPEHMHVLLGIGEQRTLRYDDFAAYYRRVRARFEEAIGSTGGDRGLSGRALRLCAASAACARRAGSPRIISCRWRACAATRSCACATPALPTMAALARAAPETEVPKIAAALLRDAARSGGAPGRKAHDRTPGLACDRVPTPGRGFELLPRPSSGDVIFDIEGDPFWEPARGLHFLFGLLLREGADWRYRPIWAHDRSGERAMFEQFVDLVHERLAADPRMHVYHYGTYENAALKQLMGVYATREDAVDELLRRNVFVNLHTVVRQGLRAGVESYSLKEVEALAAFARRADVKKRHGRRAGVRALDASHGDAARLASIAAYNEEDCRATLALRDWLVDAASGGQGVGGASSKRRSEPTSRTAASARRCGSA